LCEAKSDNVWNFIIYVGQDTTFDDFLGNELYGSKISLELIAPLLNDGYRVTMDNWFSSPDLYSKLYSKQADDMGLLPQIRKIVPDKNKGGKIKKRRKCRSLQGQIDITKRKDKKDICLMSITHDEKLVQTRVQGQDVKKPNVVVD
jgi:hypothetical protein